MNDELSNKSLKIDKSNWQSVKLGSLAGEISQRIDNPSKSEYERFVGLEHFVSGDFKIKNWGTTENLVSAMKVFQIGDILFARRNAYLRRASIVDFDGVCSGDAFVLRENHDRIVPGFLAFIVNSDELWDYANANAAGTMSKRVKWRDLAEYKFLLPPKEQQARLAELLWAADEVVENLNSLISSLQTAYQSNIDHEILGFSPNGFKIKELLKQLSEKNTLKPLGELGLFMKGKGIAKDETKSEGIPCVRYGELYTRHDIVIREFNSFINEASAINSLLLMQNDLVMAGSGETREDIGKTAVMNKEIRAYAGGDVIVFRPSKMKGTFLSYVMNSTLGKQQLGQRGTGATIFHIYPDELKKIFVPVPSIEAQNKKVEKLESFYKNISFAEEELIKSKKLQQAMLNQIF